MKFPYLKFKVKRRNFLKTALAFGCALFGVSLWKSAFIPSRETVKETIFDQKDLYLWKKTLSVMLGDPLWNKRDIYDSSHLLMVPMYAAFKANEDELIAEFRTFFGKAFSQKEFSPEINKLEKIHFLYLFSEYLCLEKEFQSRLPNHLVNRLSILFKEILIDPAWQWESKPFDGGIEERIRWKINVEKVEKSYYKALIDEDLFSLAIAANLGFLLGDRVPPYLQLVLKLIKTVFKEELSYSETISKGWLLQPGVWTDHPEYLYAGWNQKKQHDFQKPVENIAWDTSHSHRMPAFLNSFSRFFRARNDRKTEKYFNQLKVGLVNQFLNNVLVPPSEDFHGYRTTNFMDGKNGIYRYSYHTDSKGLGYGPYELSGTFLFGWWSFLESQKIRQAYCYMAARYPLSDTEISLYLGPDTTRDRHPLIKGKAQYTSGILELISRLSCKLHTL